MRDSIKIILLFFIGGFIFSCEKATLVPEEVDLEIPVSFEQEIIPIFDSKCVGCHNGNRKPDLRAEFAYESLTTEGYIDTLNAEQSDIMVTLYDSHDSRATETEKNKILAWIKQGAENN